MIRTRTGLAAVANFTTFMVLSTMVLFATEITGLDQQGYGLMLGGEIGPESEADVIETTSCRFAGA